MSMLQQIPTNDAVEWHGTRYGLHPALSDEAEAVRMQGDAIIPALIGALDDPDRFVTAHVLLTRLAGVQYDTFPDWNGLYVDLRADGNVVIDSDQAPELAARWQAFDAMDPKPDILPPLPENGPAS
jgi:hypothetical protein